MLTLCLPCGSLQQGTVDLFAAADLDIETPDSRCYEAVIDDPRIGRVRWMRPQEIPIYVRDGLFDLGIAGQDWIAERGCSEEVEAVAKLHYSRQSRRAVRIVVAVPETSPITKASDIVPGSKITTEYVSLTKRFFSDLNISVNVEFSYGTTEAKVPEIADAAVELTESGSSLRANRLKIVDTIMESSTMLMANKASWRDKDKRKDIEEIVTLIVGALEARGRVLIKMNVRQENFERVLAVLPSMKLPTVSELLGKEPKYFAVESVVEKAGINVLIPKLKAAGAEDILELPISKVIR